MQKLRKGMALLLAMLLCAGVLPLSGVAHAAEDDELDTLTISKTVEGTDEDKEKDYSFTINFGSIDIYKEIANTITDSLAYAERSGDFIYRMNVFDDRLYQELANKLGANAETDLIDHDSVDFDFDYERGFGYDLFLLTPLSGETVYDKLYDLIVAPALVHYWYKSHAIPDDDLMYYPRAAKDEYNKIIDTVGEYPDYEDEKGLKSRYIVEYEKLNEKYPDRDGGYYDELYALRNESQLANEIKEYLKEKYHVVTQDDIAGRYPLPEFDKELFADPGYQQREGSVYYFDRFKVEFRDLRYIDNDWHLVMAFDLVQTIERTISMMYGSAKADYDETPEAFKELLRYYAAFNMNESSSQMVIVAVKPAYTIYDADSNVVENGIVEEKDFDFTLKDGWRIEFEDLPDGVTYTVKETNTNNATETNINEGANDETEFSSDTNTDDSVSYSNKFKGSVDVKHVAEDGTVLKDTEFVEENAIAGTSYTTSEGNFDGYKFKQMDSDSADASGEVKANETLHVIYVYESAKGTVKVEYRDKDTNELISTVDTIKDSAPTGEDYTATRKDIDGYTFDSWDSSSAAETGQVEEGVKTVVYYYTRDKGSVIVRYLDEETLEPLEDVTTLMDKEPTGTAYESMQKKFDDYTFSKMADDSAPTSGEVKDDVQTITYLYKKDRGTVKVEHRDRETGEVLESSTLKDNERVGEDYKANSTNIDGYKFHSHDAASADEEGKVTKDTQTVVYFYDKTYSETYEFKSEDGSELPKEVTNLLPTRKDKYVNGDEVTPETLSQTSVETDDGTWEFVKWEEDIITIDNADAEFVGIWKFTRKQNNTTDPGDNTDPGNDKPTDPGDDNPTDPGDNTKPGDDKPNSGEDNKPTNPVDDNKGSNTEPDNNENNDNTKNNDNKPVNNDVPATGASTAPKTGDDTNIALWLSLMGGSLIGLIAVAFGKRKRYAGRHSK